MLETVARCMTQNDKDDVGDLMSRRLGLIIGVNQYYDATFHPLQYAENDARALAQWLVNAKGGNWSPPDVQLVQGEHATKELIESLMAQMCLSIAGPNDLVFIYFAGHAFVDERSGEGYLALANTQYQASNTALHLASFAQQIMAHSRAANLLLILDCFQTGPTWIMQRTSPFDFKPLLNSIFPVLTQQQRNRLLLCSCRGNEQTAEAGERGLGLFMYRTIVGLCGPASDSTSGSIPLRNLHGFLTNALPEQQRPHLFGQEHYPLILVGEMPPVPTMQAQPFPTSPPASPISSPPMTQSSLGFQRVADAQPLMQNEYSTTATAQMPPPQRVTSGLLSQSNVERQQQQSQQILAQAQQYVAQQQPMEALALVEQALQIAPSDTVALTLKGQLLGTIGRFPEALAVVEQLLQINPNNALVWSMRAVLLTNMGQYQAALTAIEQALSLDPQNAETYGIKNSIMEQIAIAQSRNPSQKRAEASSQKQRGGPLSFLIGAVLQIIGLGVGIAGILLPIIQPQIPLQLAFALESIGLSLLCVNAARGAFRHGFLRLLITLFLSIIPVAAIGIAYKFGYDRIVLALKDHPNLIVPMFFLVVWLALAAALPLLLAIGGFIAGLVLGVRRRKTS